MIDLHGTPFAVPAYGNDLPSKEVAMRWAEDRLNAWLVSKVERLLIKDDEE